MTKEQWKERLPVIQAWIDGKTIQHRQLVDEWCDVGWANINFNFECDEFRIKPEPREFWLLDGRTFETKEAAELWAAAINVHWASIHVREVLE